MPHFHHPSRLTHQYRRSSAGFTLVELAIVIVIIGLIVGGVLAGFDLLRGQSVRNVLADARTYAIARQQFQDKYAALPGDMADATRVWGNAEGGAATANCATPATSASTGQATCSGNGDGLIGTAGAEYESLRFWQHLWAAGLIKGRYCGISTATTACTASGTTGTLPNVNAPKSAFGNGTFFADSAGTISSGIDATLFDGDYDNRLGFGGVVVGAAPTAAVLSPDEAQIIDTKGDDGLPGLGNIRATKTVCVTSTDPQVAAYAVTLTGPRCMLYFLRTFQQRQQ